MRSVGLSNVKEAENIISKAWESFSNFLINIYSNSFRRTYVYTSVVQCTKRIVILHFPLSGGDSPYIIADDVVEKRLT